VFPALLAAVTSAAPAPLSRTTALPFTLPPNVQFDTTPHSWLSMHAGWLTHSFASLFVLSGVLLVVLLALQTTKQEGLSGTLGGPRRVGDAAARARSADRPGDPDGRDPVRGARDPHQPFRDLGEARGLVLALLEVRNLKTTFKTEDGIVAAVNGLSFAVEPGSTLGIVGESGSGKSVTSLSIMRLLATNGRIESGEVLFKGEDLLLKSEAEMRKIRGRDIAMIFQDPMTSLNPVLTIGEQIAEATRLHLGLSNRDAMAKAVDMLRLVRIPARKSGSRTIRTSSPAGCGSA